MKNFLLTAVLILSSFAYSQDLQYPEYVDTGSESIVVSEVQDAISQSTTYNEVVIIAKDSGTTPTLPAWFNPTMNGLHELFSEGTFGQFDYNNIVLKAGENEAFLFAEVYRDTFPGNCWHVHKRENMIDVIEQADEIYDFSLLDFNGDNIVPVHFTSIGPLSGGVSGNCLTVTTTDIGVGGQYIQVQVVQQTRGINQDAFRGVFYHESGHTFFNFPDMNHANNGDFNHYGIGAFDIMCGGGFQGVPSLYNPWFRNVRQWCSPTLIESNLTGAVLEDFQTSQNYYLFIPSYNPPNAMTDQKFLISYHNRNNQFYFYWPFNYPFEGGGTLVWHTRENTVLKYDSYSDWRRMKLDVESAHGKFKWNEFSTFVVNTGIEDPLTGRDSLEIRKIAWNGREWQEIQGPYYGVDDGSASIFYTPDEAGDFTFYSNPNSNWYINSSQQSYAQNIVSGFAMRNLRNENGVVKADFYINDLTITENTVLSKGKWYIYDDIQISQGVTVTVQEGTALIFNNGSSFIVNGSLVANGTQTNKITFDFIEPDNENENGIKVNFGGEITISNAIVKNAFKGINIVGGDRSSIQYSLIQYCSVGIDIDYENKDCDLKIMYNEIKNNSGYGIRIHNPGFGMNSEPFVSDNYIASCYFGIHLTGDVCALIQKSVVENCTNGIYVYDAQPSILNNSILNPLQNGIYCNAPGKSPLILDNVVTKQNDRYNYQGIWVENNTTAYIAHNDISGFFHGIYCGGGVNSYFGNYDFHDLYPNNRIRDNLFGFAAGWGSYIYAGKGIGDGCWNNSIYGNRDYDVVSYQYSYVMAQYNYWGGDRPNAYVDESSELYADDLLERDPWGENKIVAGSSNNPLPIEGGNSDIAKGILLEKNGQINEAVKHYKQMVSKNSYAGFALTELLKFKKKYSVTGVQNYFGTLISANNINKDKVLRILAAIYLDENRYEEAMQTYTTIINQFPNSRNAVYARFDKFYAALNHAQNLTTAGQLLQEIRSLSLTDDEFLMKLEFAETLYNSTSGSTILGKSSVQTVKQQIQQTLPGEYALFGNYPNPFNPSTSISYALPFESEVSITIYDLTGRIIKTFDLNNQSAGYKNVIWDGRNNNSEEVSSGVYIYTIRAVSLEGNGKTFAKSSKLVLLK